MNLNAQLPVLLLIIRNFGGFFHDRNEEDHFQPVGGVISSPCIFRVDSMNRGCFVYLLIGLSSNLLESSGNSNSPLSAPSSFSDISRLWSFKS